MTTSEFRMNGSHPVDSALDIPNSAFPSPTGYANSKNKSPRMPMPSGTKNESKGILTWPEDERPRERLLSRGPQDLTDGELLAILLRVGVRGKSAVELGHELVKRFG